MQQIEQWLIMGLNWIGDSQWVWILAIILLLGVLRNQLRRFVIIDGVKDENGDDIPLNLFSKFWYITILPGAIGATMVFLGGFYAVFGWGLVLSQIIAWIIWYFSTTGDPAHWTIILVAGEMIGFRKAGRFMCPRLGKLLAYLDKSIRVQVQAVWGERGKDKDGAEESGSELGVIRYSKMVKDPDPTKVWPHPFPEDYPLNLDTSEAKPEVTLLVNIQNPIKIRRLDVRDSKDPTTRIRRGVNVAVGQIAESVRNGYQQAVAGRSASWVPYNLKAISAEIRTEIESQLAHRGLGIERHTMPAITHYGETAAMRKNIADFNDARVGGEAKVEAAKQKADEDKQKGVGIKNLATANAEARERLAQALEKELEAKIQPMLDADVPRTRIADILEQQAVRSGLPRLPKSVRDVIFGSGHTDPELWRGLGDDGTPAGAKSKDDKPKDKDGEKVPAPGKEKK